jgi:hypothetical protein
MKKIELRMERQPTGAYFVWHDWWRSAPVAGALRIGQLLTLQDGRMVMRQGEKRVKWYIPPGWWEAPRAVIATGTDTVTPTGGKKRSGR